MVADDGMNAHRLPLSSWSPELEFAVLCFFRAFLLRWEHLIYGGGSHLSTTVDVLHSKEIVGFGIINYDAFFFFRPQEKDIHPLLRPVSIFPVGMIPEILAFRDLA
ncbi:unnamed protein product [Calypogeia fissa]